MTPEQQQQAREHPDEFARELIEDYLHGDREYKIAVCSNGPEDLPNRIMYIPEGTRAEVILIVPMSLDDGVTMHPSDEISVCCDIARTKVGPPFLVGFMAEVYAQLPTQGVDLPKVRGVITERFKRGEPGTTEALSIMIMHRRLDGSLRMLAVNLPFRYDEGSVVFGEAQWIDSTTDGMSDGTIPKALVAAFGSEQN